MRIPKFGGNVVVGNNGIRYCGFQLNHTTTYHWLLGIFVPSLHNASTLRPKWLSSCARKMGPEPWCVMCNLTFLQVREERHRGYTLMTWITIMKRYQNVPVMAAVAVRKKVVSIGHFSPSFCFQSLQIFLLVRSNQKHLHVLVALLIREI